MGMYVIRTWVEWCAVAVLVLIGERLLLGMTWSFFVVGQLTELACATIASLRYRQWLVAGQINRRERRRQ